MTPPPPSYLQKKVKMLRSVQLKTTLPSANRLARYSFMSLAYMSSKIRQVINGTLKELNEH